MTIATRGANKIQSLVAFDLAAAREYDLRACLCEQDRGIAPNASGSTRDERDFLFELFAHGRDCNRWSRLTASTRFDPAGTGFELLKNPFSQ
jgi:hypothetical protein